MLGQLNAKRIAQLGPKIFVKPFQRDGFYCFRPHLEDNGDVVLKGLVKRMMQLKRKRRELRCVELKCSAPLTKISLRAMASKN